MKKIRNDKIDGRFYSDEYMDRVTGRIYDLERELEKYKEDNKKLLSYESIINQLYDLVNRKYNKFNKGDWYTLDTTLLFDDLFEILEKN